MAWPQDNNPRPPEPKLIPMDEKGSRGGWCLLLCCASAVPWIAFLIWLVS